MKKLTVKQEEVLGHLLNGCSNKEIARVMELAVVTVKLHVRSLRDIFGAKSRMHLVILAMNSGARPEDVTGEQLAKRVVEYFGERPIWCKLDCDIEVRDMALAILGRPKGQVTEEAA